MRLVWLALAVASCGRVDFDPHYDDGGTTVDVSDSAFSVCPAGYVFVQGNPLLGTTNFCVMQTEARAWLDVNGDNIVQEIELDDDGCASAACATNWVLGPERPVSVLPAPAEPWVGINEMVAQQECRALGVGYDLMANREWMTIARAVEVIASNWASGVIGSFTVQGNTDGTPTSGVITNPADPYSDTGNNASQVPNVGFEQRRTLDLPLGQVIWDLPGNVQEWVDWTLGGPLDGAMSCGNSELPAIACAGYAPEDYQSSTGTYDSTNGVGKLVGGSGDAVRRGGQGGDLGLAIAGIYGFNVNRFTNQTFAGTGFRCVYRL